MTGQVLLFSMKLRPAFFIISPTRNNILAQVAEALLSNEIQSYSNRNLRNLMKHLLEAAVQNYNQWENWL
jgi:hypothetical protein